MDEKLCIKCGLSKPVSEFGKDKNRTDGLAPYCKACKSQLDKKDYAKHRDARLKRSREYYASHRACLRKAEKERRKTDAVYRQKEKDYRTKHPDKVQKWKKTYYERHKKWINAQWAEKRRTNLDERLKNNMRARLNKALRGDHKTSSIVTLLGCSLAELREHLESKFQHGMTWDNYGSGWHIDHIVPCVNFDLKIAEEQKKCFHFSNLQPLWKHDNLRKNRY